MASKILSFGVIWGLAVATSLVFIWKSNDHLECSSTTKTEEDSNGCEVTVATHVCQERFSI